MPQGLMYPGQIGPQGPPGPPGTPGATGPQGPAGLGLNIRGSVPAVADLPTTGNTTGDAFHVTGTGDMHRWNGVSWINIGPIRGPQGLTGPTGATGATGGQGPTGATGATGPQGPQGLEGPPGTPGDGGLADLTGRREDGAAVLWSGEAEQFLVGMPDTSKWLPDPRYPLRSDLPDLTYFRPTYVITAPGETVPREFPDGGVIIDASRPARSLTQSINIITSATGTITLPTTSVATLHDITLGGNITINPPTPVAGQDFTVSVRQPATGGPFTVTWGTGFKWSDATSYLPPALLGDANGVTEFKWASSRGANWGHLAPACKFAGSGTAGPTPTFAAVSTATTGTSAAASLPLTLPGTITAGHIMYLIVGLSGTKTTLATPAGWTLLSGPDGTQGQRTYLFVRVMDGLEDGTNVALDASASIRIQAAGILVSGGTRTGEVFGYQQNTAVDLTVEFPSITPTVGNSLLVNLAAIRYDAPNSPPSVTATDGYTERADFYEGRTITSTPVVQFGAFAQTKALSGQANVAQPAVDATGTHELTENVYAIAVPPPVTA